MNFVKPNLPGLTTLIKVVNPSKQDHATCGPFNVT